MTSSTLSCTQSAGGPPPTSHSSPFHPLGNDKIRQTLTTMTSSSSIPTTFTKTLRTNMRRHIQGIYPLLESTFNRSNFLRFAPLRVIFYQLREFIIEENADRDPDKRLTCNGEQISVNESLHFQHQLHSIFVGIPLKEILNNPAIKKLVPAPIYALFRYISTQDHQEEILNTAIIDWIELSMSEEKKQLGQDLKGVLLFAFIEGVQTSSLIAANAIYECLEILHGQLPGMLSTYMETLQTPPFSTLTDAEKKQKNHDLSEGVARFYSLFHEFKQMLSRSFFTTSEVLQGYTWTKQINFGSIEDLSSPNAIRELQQIITSKRQMLKATHIQDCKNRKKIQHFRALAEQSLIDVINLLRMFIEVIEDPPHPKAKDCRLLCCCCHILNAHNLEIKTNLTWDPSLEEWMDCVMADVYTRPLLEPENIDTLLEFITGTKAPKKEKKSRSSQKRAQPVHPQTRSITAAAPAETEPEPKLPLMQSLKAQFHSASPREKNFNAHYQSLLKLYEQPLTAYDLFGLLLLSTWAVENALKKTLEKKGALPDTTNTHSIFSLVMENKQLTIRMISSLTALSSIEHHIRYAGQYQQSRPSLGRYPRQSVTDLLNHLTTFFIHGSIDEQSREQLPSFVQDMLRYGVLAPLKIFQPRLDLQVSLPLINLDPEHQIHPPRSSSNNIEILLAIRNHFKQQFNTLESSYERKGLYFQLFLYFDHFYLEQSLFSELTHTHTDPLLLDAKHHHRLYDMVAKSRPNLLNSITAQEKDRLYQGPKFLQLVRYPYDPQKSGTDPLFSQTSSAIRSLLEDPKPLDFIQAQTLLDTIEDMTDSLLKRL